MKNFFYSTLFILALISFFQAASFAGYFNHYVIEYGDNLPKIIYKLFPETRSDKELYQKSEKDIKEWNPQIGNWDSLIPGVKIFSVKPISPFINTSLPVKDMVNFKKELKKDTSKYRPHMQLSLKAYQQDIQYKSPAGSVDLQLQSFLAPYLAFSFYDHVATHPLELGISHQTSKWTSAKRDNKTQSNAKDEASFDHQTSLYWGIRNLGNFLHLRVLARYDQFSYLQYNADDIWKFKILSTGISAPIYFDWKLNQVQLAPFYLKEISNDNDKVFGKFISYGITAKLQLPPYVLECDYQRSSLEQGEEKLEETKISFAFGVFF